LNRLIAFLPCYNEEENIRPLARAWEDEAPALAAEGFALKLYAIDDKSTDGTLVILRALESELSGFGVIAHERNRGLGGALDTAVSRFLAEAGPGDYMAFMDGDNTHRPVYLHQMLRKARVGAGCVIASRYRKGAEIKGLPRRRRLMSSAARFFYGLVLHVPGVRDYTCGFRLYAYECLEKARERYGGRLITQRSFSCMMELLYKLYRSGCRFDESPFVLYYGDKKGASKMKALKTAWDSVVCALSLRTEHI
jgi:dolichol-phosphate mannosyltransferase